MEVILYNTTSDATQVTKALTTIATLSNVHPVDAQDMQRPLLKIGSVDISSIKNVNFAYIPEYGRYYYVDAPVVQNNKVCALSLSVDVLMSFDSSIRNLTALVSRQEKNYNLYLPDPEFKVYANTDKKTLRFSNTPFTKTPNFLLTVSGGT